jgi:hypothetical protein
LSFRLGCLWMFSFLFVFSEKAFFFFIVTSMSLFCLILEYYLKYQAMIDDFFCKHVYILEGFFFFLKLEPRLKDFINLNENKKKRVYNSGLFFVKPFLH